MGADGANSNAARSVGVRRAGYVNIYFGLQCYFRGVKGLKENIEMHFLDGVHPGYFWIFPVDNGLANVGVSMTASDIRSRRVNLREAMSRAMKENP